MPKLIAFVLLGIVAQQVGCQSNANGPMKIELERRSVGSNHEVVSFFVEPHRLTSSGITELECRKYVVECLNGVGKLAGEAVVDLVGSVNKKPSVPVQQPAWVPTVFPDGIKFEITIISNGNERTESFTLTPPK